MPTYTVINEKFSDIIQLLMHDDAYISDQANQEELMEMYLIIGSLLKWRFKSFAPVNNQDVHLKKLHPFP